MKHSKGPWRAAGLSVFQGEIRVARAFYNAVPLEEGQANAQLIAAAPDMLEAIDMVLWAASVKPDMVPQYLNGLVHASKKARGL